MKEEIIRSILKKVQNGDISKKAGTELCYEIKNFKETEHQTSFNLTDIAVIGLAGRYPKASNLKKFWENLANGENCITTIPPDRWNWEDYYNESKQRAGEENQCYSKYGGFLDGIDKFDAMLFHISPNEARYMDPQERLFLETAWETFEDAGYSKSALELYQKQKKEVGVFVGATWQEYQFYSGMLDPDKEVTFATNACNIANRVSYYFNLSGASMSVDTACSSSMTALHLACESLRNGSNAMALAGGVNLTVHPNKYVSLAKFQFMSEGNECRSFGKGGDGYIPSEGVGAVLLKPLSEAIKDNDHIYGVIKATAINHGAKASGYTVPNPVAQGEVIETAIKNSGVNPRTISYLEAHGTGTALGDPIEVDGLEKAYRKYTYENQFCAIGSVKSNIGHCESAAGIAALTKVLLQMKYGKLVPSLNSQETNPDIEFEKSPFYVQQKLKEWERPLVMQNGVSQRVPRRAGISSFGAGGSNAHIIVEEFIKESLEHVKEIEKAVIVLSAKSQERLYVYAKRILEEIQENNKISLTAVAYTLQTGREFLEHRIAFTATTVSEMTSKLAEYIEKKDAATGVYTGALYNSKQKINIKLGKAELLRLCKDGDYETIARQWVKGADVLFENLYEEKPEKCSLPFYPFSPDRYWVQNNKNQESKKNGQGVIGKIHPLIHENISNLYEERFYSEFTGEEDFFADHVVNGQRILPGVAYLEMAREAVCYAYDISTADEITVILKNVVWASPIAATQGMNIKVYTRLRNLESNGADFEICCEDENGKKKIHCYGKTELKAGKEEKAEEIIELEAQCSLGQVSHEQCYDAYDKIGIQYGDSHCGVQKIAVGEEKTLAYLQLQDVFVPSLEHYTIHPALADAALQSTIGLMIDFGDKEQSGLGKAMIPFVLEEADIYCTCTEKMYAVAKFCEGCSRDDNVQRINVDLYDESGRLCMQFKSYTSREIKKGYGMLYMSPVWKQQEVVLAAEAETYHNRNLFLCGKNLAQIKENFLSGADIKSFYFGEEDAADIYEKYAKAIFLEVKNILLQKQDGKTLIQLVTTSSFGGEVLSSLAALLKTASMESINIIAQTIEVDSDVTKEELKKILLENEASGKGGVIQYRDSVRYENELEEINENKLEQGTPWREGGVYLITGGCGGLGLIFAEEITRTAEDCVVILTGRSPLTQDKQKKIEYLNQLGGSVFYQPYDITDKQQVKDLIQFIKKNFGTLNGVIHAAGVVHDSFIRNKSVEEFEYVLKPKTAGLLNLDLTTQDIDLDFLVSFSSTSSITGNFGQADYATANAFIDNYTKRRNRLVKKGKRKGITKVVNWPLWKDGSMHVDTETERMMLKTVGMVPMETDLGLQAFYQMLNGTQNQLVVIEGNVEKLRSSYMQIDKEGASLQDRDISSKVSEEQITPIVEKNASGDMRSIVESDIRKMVVDILDVDFQKVNVETDINDYGFDSLTYIKLSDSINSKYDVTTTPTLFYEYVTIKELTQYLLKEFPELFTERALEKVPEKVLGRVLEQTEAINKQAEVQSMKEAVIPRQRRMFQNRLKQTVSIESRNKVRIHAEREPIAIIGMSGAFPNSEDMEAFWNNLIEGTDCIIEIPKERWDWREYYGDPVTEVNKCNVKWGGFLKDIRQFDPLFFGISPREAELMDPEQRFLMMHVWNTIEDAGYSARSLAGSETGIFVGTMSSGYDALITAANLPIEGYTLTGMVPSVGPNRMSYFLDFHGPSEPVETACSSSLVAVQRAISAINEGNCDKAIAGGISAIVTPDGTISCNKSGMLSPDGHCKTFSDKADGYVRSEGVGMFFLKRLSDAEADGDHIYGTIIGISENHGGHATSLTAPNPKAQSALLKKAYTNAQVDPRTITYIEMHGTGTQLGDPTEINGLKSAFKSLYEETGNTEVMNAHCVLGAVKTNVGHLEVAAGAAGLAKVLLMLKHKQIPKILHLDHVNPYIQLQNSPFRLADKNMEWEALRDQNGNEIPRRAGISSFGFGGANAHVVIEEYQEKKRESQIHYDASNPAIIVLSAKTDEGLNEKVERLYHFIDKGNVVEKEFPDMMYTLIVGRDEFEKRIAFLAESLEDTKEKLDHYIQGERRIENFYVSAKSQSQQMFENLFAVDDTDVLLRLWCSKKEYGKIARAWVQGMKMNFALMFSDVKMKRISLPGYPFAKERYWIPEKQNQVKVPKAKESIAGKEKKSGKLSPKLVNSMDGTFDFILTLSGTETFITDHVVNHNKVLPGVAYIEIITKALEQITDIESYRLTELVWLIQCKVKDRKQVNIQFIKNKEGYEFSVYTEEKENRTEHAKGYFMVLESNKGAESLNIQEIQARLTNKIDVKNMYHSFAQKGIEYGEAFQVIQKIQTGENEALSLVKLPDVEEFDYHQFLYHPSIMDGALQTMAGVVSGNDDLMLPFYVDSVERYASIPKKVYIYVLRLENKKFMLVLMDETGRVCVKLNQVLLRNKAKPKQDNDIYFMPQWVESEMSDKPFNPHTKTLIVAPEYTYGLAERIADTIDRKNVQFVWLGNENKDTATGFMIDIDDKDALQSCMQRIGKLEQVYFLGGISDGKLDLEDIKVLENSQKLSVITLFRLLHVLVDNGLMTNDLRIVTITNNVYQIYKGEDTNPLAASMFGLIKSCQKEFNETSFCSVDVELSGQTTEVEKEELVQKICTRELRNNGEEFVIRGSRYYIKRLVKAELTGDKKIAFSNKGVYFVLGGAGGIGMELTKYLTSTYQAKVAIIGRSDWNDDKKAAFQQMEQTGGKVLYVQADANNIESMRAAVKTVNEKLGPVQGVVHSAIVLRDRLFAFMEEERFLEGINPKIRGSYILNMVMKDQPLDFMLFFSSAQSFACSLGQCNYAAGCGFKDNFAEYLDMVKDYSVKTINWGYWGTVGVVASEKYEKLQSDNGIISLYPEEGMEAVEKVLSNAARQVMVMKATKEAITGLGIGDDCLVVLEDQRKVKKVVNILEHAKQVPAQRNKIEANAEAMKLLDQYADQYILYLFQKNGFLEKDNTEYDIADMRKQLKIQETYWRLYEVMLNFLEESGFANIESGKIITKQVQNLSHREDVLRNLELQKDKVITEESEAVAYRKLLEVCLESCLQVMQGKKFYTEVMFPNDSVNLVENIYQGNEYTDYYNRVVAEIVKEYTENKLKEDKSKVITILEIGAGVGGTSRGVMERLGKENKNIVYYYTDISKQFIEEAADKFASYRYIKYELLNVEKDVEEQNFAKHSVDIILATNVIHATSNISKSLSHIKDLLKARGILILNEVTMKQRFTTLTFGLATGWWLYEDEENRIKGTPALLASTWRRLMEEQGFTKPYIIDYPGDKGESIQSVIVGQSNGIFSEESDNRMQSETENSVYSEHTFAEQPEEIAEDILKGPVISAVKNVTEKEIMDGALEYIMGIFSETLKMSVEQLDADYTYEKYGVDSMLNMELNKRLKDDFGKIPGTLLFECITMRQLSEYLVKNKREQLLQLLFGEANESEESEEYQKFETQEKDGLNVKKADTLEEYVNAIDDDKLDHIFKMLDSN